MKSKEMPDGEEKSPFDGRIDPQIMEHLDAYVLVGYTADGHKKVLHRNFGRDPSCRDGLQVIQTVAQHWLQGTILPGQAGQGGRDTGGHQ